MSDYSRNASIESPSSPNYDLPLPIPLPQVSIDVDPELEYHVSTPSPTPSPTLVESILLEGRISPQSALAILQAFGTGGSDENLRQVMQVTSRTLFQCTQAYEAMIRGLWEDVARPLSSSRRNPRHPTSRPQPPGIPP